MESKEKKKDTTDEKESEKKFVEKSGFLTEEQIEKLIGNIRKTIERSGFDLYDRAADPIKTEYLIYSEKLNLYGRPPKILTYEEKLLPYIIRTSNAPVNGIWENDRISAAAYSMIMEKEYGHCQNSEYAIVDYFGDYRLFRIRDIDKKKALRAIRKIKEIKKGKMPAEKNILLCKSCRYQEKCRPKMKTIFSKLFEKDRI